MTLEEIERLDSNVLTVKQVADFLGKDQQVIREQAKRDARQLGFPICVAGRGYSIPKAGFLTWAKGLTPALVLDRSLIIDTAAALQKKSR